MPAKKKGLLQLFEAGSSASGSWDMLANCSAVGAAWSMGTQFWASLQPDLLIWVAGNRPWAALARDTSQIAGTSPSTASGKPHQGM
jgi:hypothetical protein